MPQDPKITGLGKFDPQSLAQIRALMEQITKTGGKVEQSTDPSRITVPTIDSLSTRSGYLEFIQALQAAYDLYAIDPKTINWQSTKVKPSSIGYPPSIVIDPEQNVPKLSVCLHPTKENTPVTGSYTYHAPVLLADVQRWSTSNLRKYKLDGLSGVPEEREFFKRPISLSQLVSSADSLKEVIKDSTPVVEGIVILPIAKNGEFNTEFCPQISFGDGGDHRHYEIVVINESKLSVYSALTNGQYREIKNIDQNQNAHSFLAEYVPDLSDFEKLTLPNNHGHIILIAIPVEDPSKKFFKDLSSLESSDPFGTDRSSSPMKSMGTGDIKIGTGSYLGKATLYEGDLSRSREGKPVIYHLRFIGVKEEEAKLLTDKQMAKLIGSVSNFELN